MLTNIPSPAVLLPHGAGIDDCGALNLTFKVLCSQPFYYSDRPNLLPYVSDRTLSLLAPVVAYVSAT